MGIPWWKEPVAWCSWVGFVMVETRNKPRFGGDRRTASISLHTPGGSSPTPHVGALALWQICWPIWPPLLCCSPGDSSVTVHSSVTGDSSVAVHSSVAQGTAVCHTSWCLRVGHSLGHAHPTQPHLDLRLKKQHLMVTSPWPTSEFQQCEAAGAWGRGSHGLTSLSSVCFCIRLDCCQPFPIHKNPVGIQSLIKKGLVWMLTHVLGEGNLHLAELLHPPLVPPLPRRKGCSHSLLSVQLISKSELAVLRSW